MDLKNKLLGILKVLSSAKGVQISIGLRTELVDLTNEAINYTRCSLK
jgi:hypothetical protein